VGPYFSPMNFAASRDSVPQPVEGTFNYVKGQIGPNTINEVRLRRVRWNGRAHLTLSTRSTRGRPDREFPEHINDNSGGLPSMTVSRS